MFGATFHLFTHVELPLFLKRRKMVVWKSIVSLALNNCFSYRNVFQNGVNSLSKMIEKTWFFVKSSKFCILRTIRFCSNFTSMWSKYLSNNVWRDFRLPMSPLATVAGKSFNSKLTAKIDFLLGYFIVQLLMLTLEALSLSIHYLISIWTTCRWNMNKIVWFKLYKIFELIDKNWLMMFF